MQGIDRLALARRAYEGALARARVEPTAQAWVRLLRAAENLREARSRRPGGGHRVARRASGQPAGDDPGPASPA